MVMFAIGIVALCAGIIAILYGIIGTQNQLVAPIRQSRYGRRVSEMWRTYKRNILISLVVGIIAFAFTGWPIILLLTPSMGIVIPILLSTPPNYDIEMLEALDRWVRNLAATLPSGRSIADAVRLSRKQAPKLLLPYLNRVTMRLDQRWTLTDALHRMADEISSADADAVLAALILAAQRGGTGAGAILKALADSSQEQLKALREIDAERAKPRIVVRQVTLISLIVLSLMMVFSKEFFAPYSTFIGQIILAILLAAYMGSLWFLRRLTLPPVRARILGRQ